MFKAKKEKEDKAKEDKTKSPSEFYQETGIKIIDLLSDKDSEGKILAVKKYKESVPTIAYIYKYRINKNDFEYDKYYLIANGKLSCIKNFEQYHRMQMIKIFECLKDPRDRKSVV